MATTTPVAAAPCVNIEKSLSLGSRGDDVTRLQKFLGVISTGYFGPLTKQSVIQWQISHKVIVSAKADGAGSVGPKTRAALHCASTPAFPPSSGVPSNLNTVPSASPIATSTAPVPATSTPAPASSGGGGNGGGGYTGPAGYFCQNLAPQPNASACTTGQWETIQDEAGCYVWDCMDPSNIQG